MYSCLNSSSVVVRVLHFSVSSLLLSFYQQAWSEFIQNVDPDIITGYNIIDFDMPYLLNRAKALQVNHFPYLGRVNNVATVIKTSTFESKAYGKRENKVMNIEGRIQFDLLQVKGSGTTN